jgi:hypothetical protein
MSSRMVARFLVIFIGLILFVLFLLAYMMVGGAFP